MAQTFVSEGTEFFDKTGNKFIAAGAQDVGGQKGQFISSSFSLTNPIQGTPTQAQTTDQQSSPFRNLDLSGPQGVSAFEKNTAPVSSQQNNQNNFKVSDDQITNLSSDIIESATQSPTSQFDIESILEEQRGLRESLLEAIKPGASEIEIQNQLADVRQSADLLRQSFDAGVVDIEGKVIPLTFQTGQLQNLEKRFNLKLSGLQREEANLIARLGLAQDLRQSTIDAVNAGLSFLESDLDLRLNLEEKLYQRQQDALDVALRMEERSLTTLDTILSSFAGISFDQLSSGDQAKLLSLARASNIPADALINMMNVTKDNLEYTKIKEQLDLDLKRAQIGATNRRNTSGGSDSTVVSPGFIDLDTEQSVRDFALEIHQSTIDSGFLNDDWRNEEFRTIRTRYNTNEASDNAIWGILDGLHGVDQAGINDIEEESPLPGDTGSPEVGFVQGVSEVSDILLGDSTEGRSSSRFINFLGNINPFD